MSKSENVISFKIHDEWLGFIKYDGLATFGETWRIFFFEEGAELIEVEIGTFWLFSFGGSEALVFHH